MRPRVAQLRALANPDNAERELLDALGPFAAAPGMYFLVDLDTETIIEPALLWLTAKHGRDGTVREDEVASLRSSRASAYELAEWFSFLARVRRPWARADHDLIYLYAHLKASRLSRHTGRARQPSTIGHKLSVVYGFYSWFNSMHVTDVRWDLTTVRAAYARGAGGNEATDIDIHPFAPAELKVLLGLLGPLPSELPKGGLRPTRDRLVFETGLLTGMRGEEITFVPISAIKKLKPNRAKPDETQPLLITVTKRRIKRWVALPNSLIHELQLYIGGERVRAMEGSDLPDHGRLFVNMPGTSRSGRPMTTGTIHRRTHALMIRAGFAEVAHRTVDDASIRYMRTVHSFHDTRHTYAVNLYIGQKRAGDTEPWKTVQVMLGHGDWTTTERYYLRAVGVFEPRVGVTLNRYWEDVA